MQRSQFMTYLMTSYEKQGGGHLPEPSAVSYCDYVAGVEDTLRVNLDHQDLGPRKLVELISRYRVEARHMGTPEKTIGNRTTGLKAYARFRGGDA